MRHIVHGKVPSDGVDRDSGGVSGHLLKMILRSRETFQAGVPIHLHCLDPPRLTIFSFPWSRGGHAKVLSVSWSRGGHAITLRYFV